MPRPAAFATLCSKPRTFSSAIPTTWKPTSCWAGFTCARWATCRPGNGSQNVLKLAIEQYEQIIKIEPDNVDDHLLLGRLYRLNNDLQKAEGEFKTRGQAGARFGRSRHHAGLPLQRRRRHGPRRRSAEFRSRTPAARPSCTPRSATPTSSRSSTRTRSTPIGKAIELDRDNLDAIRGLAENLMNDGQTDAALEQYKIIADANPEDAQTYLRMAEIYRKSGKFDLALENLKKAGVHGAGLDRSARTTWPPCTRPRAATTRPSRYCRTCSRRPRRPTTATPRARSNNRAVFLERLGTIYRDNENDTRRRSRLSARCWRWATTMPNAATSRSSTPTAKPSSGSRPPTRPRKRCRSCPTIAA